MTLLVQVAVSPPTVIVFCNNPDLFPENYRRYLDRKFRESLDFQGTPLRWFFRGKSLRSMERGTTTRRKPVPYGNA
jgi:GTPase